MALWVSAFDKNTVAMAQNKKISRGGETRARGSMSTDAFGMKNEDYFSSPFKNVNDVGDKLVENGFDGLIIGGPDYIPIGKVDRFPVVALRVAESMESSRHLFNEYALITAIDLSSSEFHANAFVERRSITVERDLENNPPPPGRVTDGGATDLFTSLSMPKQIGDYLVTVILLDKTSNRIRVRVGPSELEHDISKFEKTLRSSREKVGLKGRRVTAEKSFRFAQESNSPSIPVEQGIVLKTDTQWMEKDKAGIVSVYGSYNLANPHNRTPGATSTPTGVEITTTPLSLLATGTHARGAWVLEMDLPISKEARNSNAEFLTGFFTLRLAQSDGLKGNHPYYFRAFSGSQVSDPVEATLPTK